MQSAMSVAGKGGQSPLHKAYKEDKKNDATQLPTYQNRSTDTHKEDDLPKYSSFLYGEQFCGDEFTRIPPAPKRHSSEVFGETAGDRFIATNYHKKSKTTEASQSVDDGSTSTCSEEEKDFIVHANASRKPFAPQPVSTSPTTSAPREPSLSSQFFSYPTVPLLKSPQSRRTEFHHHQHHHHHIPLSLRGDLTSQNFFNNLKPPTAFPHGHDDENDPEDGNGGIGSELLVAAYNNFVRKLVDETLDRTITFCEQPRNAINALERICSKAWPHLEAKRHRNRIRAYLKACRRNSKKNRGQINMKEPPMNGLSVEARQMVATALNLVMKDIEQLRQELKRDNSPSVFTAKNGTLPPNLRRPESFGAASRGPIHHSGAATTPPPYSTSTSIKSSKSNEERLASIKSTSFSTIPPPTPTLPPTVAAATTPFPPPPAGLDPDCVSALMRFLPSTFQFGAEFGANFRSVAMHTAMLMNGTLATTEDEAVTGKNKLPFLEGKPTKREINMSIGIQPPPAAHFAVARYSPTLNEAASMLLDVRPLSQDDIAYFQHYQEIMHEALDYVRGVSQMLMKKVEILEGHFKLRRSAGGGAPLSFVNN
ncbi:Nucleolar protein 4-like [Echinococcus granulosus]|nr:Nucleolar protein 4-like [Echinococcus granulosus]